MGIQFDDIDILFSCAEEVGEAGDGVAAIGGLNEGVAFLTLWSADSLTEGGGGASGRDGIRGGEVWVCAFCVGGLELGEVRLHAFWISSVAATKSAKDKGFSRFFM
jgi:hypothetical protein